MNTTIHIAGTHCASCKALIEDVAGETSGISACFVNVETGETTIEYNSELDWKQFTREVERLGDYHITLPSSLSLLS
ncbi:MAG: heavy-metal-associated domain-containing protein [Patescibacteria group bacterium]